MYNQLGFLSLSAEQPVVNAVKFEAIFFLTYFFAGFVNQI